MAEPKSTALAKTIAIGERGLVLKDQNDLWWWAGLVIHSGLAPKSFNTIEKVVIATEFGALRGWAPMESLQRLAVVNGVVSMWGDIMKAEVFKSEKAEYIREFFEGKEGTDSFTAVCVSKRKDMPDEVRTEFSWADAKKAGLATKTGSWQTHPKRMMIYKARAFNLRDNFADVTQGLHMAEELEGEEPIQSADAATVLPRGQRDPDVEVIDVETVDPPNLEEAHGAPPTPVEELAARVEGMIREEVPLLVEIKRDKISRIMVSLAARATKRPALVFKEAEAWDDGVVRGCNGLLDQWGLDPEWLPQAPKEEEAADAEKDGE